MTASGPGNDTDDFIFPVEDLESQEFNPAAFVAKFRRISNLENLKDQLRQYSESLKQQLFLIINRDYRDFIGIATKLDGVDTRVEVLRRPLVDLRLDVSGLHDWLKSSLNSMESKVNRRLAIRKKREKVECALKCLDKLDMAERIIEGGGSWNASSLTEQQPEEGGGNDGLKTEKRLQRRDILKSVSKLQKFTKSSSSSSSSDFFGLPNRPIGLRKDIIEASELERSAHALASAKSYLITLKSDSSEEAKERKGSLTDGGDLRSRSVDPQDMTSSSTGSNIGSGSTTSNIILLEQRGNRLVEHLLAKIRGWLEESIVEADSGGTQGGLSLGAGEEGSRERLLKHCLRALLVLGRMDVAEAIVAANILPHARATLTQGRIDGAQGRGSFGGLGQALVALLQKVDPAVVTLLRAAEALDCDLVLGGVWTPVTGLITERFASIFNIGIASVFSEARRALDTFHDALSTELLGEKYAPVLSQRLLTDARVVAFLEKWNMPLYMRLRTQEVCSRLDAACYECSQRGLGADSLSVVYPSKEAVAAAQSSARKKAGKVDSVSGDASSGGKGRGKEEESAVIPAVVVATTLPASSMEALRNELRLPHTIGTSASAGSSADRDTFTFRLAISLVCATEAATCLHDKVHFASLSSQCLSLSLRCVVRLEAHIASAMGIATPSFPSGPAKLRGASDSLGRPITVTVPALATTTSAPTNPGTTPSKNKPETVSTPVPSTPGGGTGASGNALDDGSALPLDDMVLLAADLHSLVQWFTQCLAPYASRRVGTGATRSVCASDATIEASKKLAGTRVAVWSQVTTRLVGECTAQLAVRAVAGRYRMTNRPAPSAPSSYVDTIFAPLNNFFSQYESSTRAFAPRGAVEAPTAGISSAEDPLPWDVRVVEDVTATFCLHVASVMETAKQMDSALSRRVRAIGGKGSGTGAGTEALSDSDKINLQLRLDVEAYSSAVQGLRLSTDIPSLARLQAAVALSA